MSPVFCLFYFRIDRHVQHDDLMYREDLKSKPTFNQQCQQTRGVHLIVVYRLSFGILIEAACHIDFTKPIFQSLKAVDRGSETQL